ncbi:MAG: HEAT repeat domain-containing protein, partial [Planctomycetota bacterium]
RRLRDRDPAVRWESTLALARAGPGAVRPLLARLTEREPPVGPGSEEWPGQIWIAKAHAAYALDRLGRAALPELVATLEDATLRLAAIDALGRLPGDDALEHLVPFLREGSYSERFTAAFALAEMGPRAASAAPALAVMLDDENAGWAAADSIVHLGAGAVPTIRDALRRRPRDRLVSNLRYLGEDAAPLVPLLIELVQGENEVLQRDALSAIRALGPVARDAEPALWQLAGCVSPSGRPTSAARWLGAARALLALDVTPEEEEDLRLRLVDSGRAGPDDVARLRELVGARGFELAPRVAAILESESWDAPATVAPFGASVVPHVETYLRKGNARLRMLALDVLVRLGPDAVPALPAVQESLDDPEVGIRRRAVRVIEAAADPRAAVYLLRLFDDPKVVVEAALAYGALTGERERTDALVLASSDIWGLGSLGPRAAPAVDRVVEALTKTPGPRGKYQRANAASALRRIGAVPGDALPRMREALNDEFEVRARVALLLQEHGAAGAEAIHVLVEAVRPVVRRHMCGYRYVRPFRLRVQAIRALARMDLRPAIPVLAAVADDRDEEVAAAARRALAILDR